MNVFVLLDKGQPGKPICVVSDPFKVHAKSENMPVGYGKSLLPNDAILVVPRKNKTLSEWSNGEIAARWFSEMNGAYLELLTYTVL